MPSWLHACVHACMAGGLTARCSAQCILTLYKCGGAQQQAGLARCGLWEERRRELRILDDFSGVLRPGRMTLLLGPPASGKSTLLKALAGTLQPGRNLQVCPLRPGLPAVVGDEEKPRASG